jgi:hypothetical protein
MGDRLKRVLIMSIIVVVMLSPTTYLARKEHAQFEVLSQIRNSPNIKSASSNLNITQLWGETWTQASSTNLMNYTRILSESYPSRIWFSDNMTPSTSLEGAWTWVNQTIMSNTEGQVAFHHVTEYRSLIATKNSSGPLLKNGLIITGVIDSYNNPSANDLGASVAAVLEMARILQHYELGLDIYYVLVNRGNANTIYDFGSRAFVSWLEERGINILMSITFDRLLFERTGILYGKKIALRSYPYESYQRSSWLPDLMIHLSSKYGASRIQHLPDLGFAQGSFAYEMWRVGRPAIHVTQGYWPDIYSRSEDDTWDNQYYSYEKAREAVASVASAIIYLGLLGRGDPPAFYETGVLSFNESITTRIVISYRSYLNVTLTWDGNESLTAYIIDKSSEKIVYQRTESDGLVVMKYLALQTGLYQITSTYLGVDNATIRMNITYIEDCDGDGLSDLFELKLDTNMYSTDTDNDGLTDSFEFNYGTDPKSSDSDKDGALDLEEYNAGSSLLLNDTDGDGVSDGIEIDLGMDPTNQDSDKDGLNDFEELNVFYTNPLSSDTDADGLDDGFEIETGLNPLSPDTDGDSLSDLFEILNQIDPLSKDTDGDGWGDSYEVEFCLSPIDIDTDDDGIPDGFDWDPQQHWLNVIAPVSLISIILILLIFSYMKYRIYQS